MIDAFSITDVGMLRKLNQDFVFTSVLPLGGLPNLFIVADGMGGHKAGDYASKCAVQTVVEEIGKSKTSDPPVQIIDRAIIRANERIRRKASEDENMVGMGTTIVVCTCIDDTAYVANVGDSRLYLIDNKITQITRDHSLVEEMIRMGGLDRAEARNHPDKNIITRALGATDTVSADFFEIGIRERDTLLMCSDGLTNMVLDEDILKIVNEGSSLSDIGQTLVKTANDNGGKDNIGVVLVSPFGDYRVNEED